MIRARRARDQLVAQFLDHPDVSFIDIGYVPGETPNDQNRVLRIHVRDRWMQSNPEDRISFPAAVEGIRVVVISGDYQPETNPSTEENDYG
ncbi:MAG TPA: hypothetical protein IGS37_17985 [Synechococcales cyanobacterium M55_K2018_004]|nr:hypothetical protein [Synechococcales cyanobacterium M55_K2018_004]